MKRICLFDLSGIFRAAWHASEHLEIGEAYRRTIDTVHACASDFDAAAVCIDTPPYKRREIAPDYKAQRDAAPEAMYEQQRAAIAALRDDGLPIFGADGYEADDVIATIVAWATKAGHHVTIYSADKDLLQLVGENVVAISTATRQKFGVAEVRAKFGVPPEFIPDLLALGGDASDNIKVLKGVGTKTAAAWLAEFGGLDEVLRNADKLTPERFREAVKQNKEALGTAWRLAQLMTDAPIKPEEILMERKEAKRAEPTPRPVVETPAEAPRAAPLPTPTALTRAEPVSVEPVEWDKALEPRTHQQAWSVAQMLFESRLFGAFPNAQAILAIIMTGRTMGLDAATSLRSFHLIEGKPCPHAHLLIGLVKRSPVCEYFQLIESTHESATYETKRKGDPEPTRLTYTISQANAAGLLRPSKSGRPSQWETRPDEMIRKTCAVQLARAVYPDFCMGLYSIEEMSAAA